VKEAVDLVEQVVEDQVSLKLKKFLALQKMIVQVVMKKMLVLVVVLKAMVLAE